MRSVSSKVWKNEYYTITFSNACWRVYVGTKLVHNRLLVSDEIDWAGYEQSTSL